MLSTLKIVCLWSYILCICIKTIELSSENSGSKTSNEKKQEIQPPCQACRALVNSFKKGMERTARGKFEGGDTSWEESRLGAYADSEIRLVEIQESLCTDVVKASEQCHRLAEAHESLIEAWWFKKKEYPDIYYYLCIDKLEVCCPENHFGPDCKPCSGGIVNPCNSHGQCKGDGTRKGSGLCRCDTGYVGETCDKCKIGYYNDTSGSSWSCQKCDKSCKGHCRESGPKGCEVCADGYHHIIELGCIDFDECMESPTPVCRMGTFCVNAIGSYRCVECDKSCNGCKGDGPDMCEACAEGYILQDSICIENKVWKRSLHIEIARYATYLGLCVATCIICRRNVYMAGIIGIFVAVYIGLSEYTVGEWDKRSVIKSIRSLLLL